MNEEEIKKIARETFIENVMNNLDSAIIFKYIQELEQENTQLKDKLNEIKKVIDGYMPNEYAMCKAFDEIEFIIKEN